MKTSSYPLALRTALMLGAALVSTQALAQELTPPPIITVEPAPQPVPPPAPAPASSQPSITFAPESAVVQDVPETPEPEPVSEKPAPAKAQPARTTAARTSAPAEAPARPAEARAPAPEAAPASEAETVTPVAAEEPAPPPVYQPAPVAAEPVTETPAPRPVWPWLVLGILLIAGVAAALLLRNRSSKPVSKTVSEPQYVPEPRRAEIVPPAEPVLQPVAATPVMAAMPAMVEEEEPMPIGPIATEAHVTRADSLDLEGVADTKAPVSKRPWLEFGIRPVRAGTSSDEALVEVELIVGNAGDTPAEDVRISTFMLLDDGSQNEIESALIEPSVPPQTIRPGEGAVVDSTMAVHRSQVNGRFSPVVVADARYRLPDGSEGRTHAAFRVGLDEAGQLRPIVTGRPEMHDNLAVELHGTPEHA